MMRPDDQNTLLILIMQVPGTSLTTAQDGDMYRFADPAHGSLLLDGFRASREMFCDITLRVSFKMFCYYNMIGILSILYLISCKLL